MRRNPRPPRPHPTESETELENEGLEIGVNEHCRGESTRKSKGAIAPPPLKRENGITKATPPPPPYGNPVFPVQPRTVARTVGSQNHSTEIGNIRHPFVSFSCPPLCS